MGRKKQDQKKRNRKNNVKVMPLKNSVTVAEAKESEKPESIEDLKKRAKGAKKALRLEVRVKVKENCKEFAKQLVDHASNGDMRSAAMAISLMDKKKKNGEDHDWDGPSIAELLAAEPPWEEDKEQGSGNKEQKTGTEG